MAILRVVLILTGVLLLGLIFGPFLVPIPPLTGTLPPEKLAWPDSRFVEVNGIQVHYQQQGSGQPAMILLHGFGASTFSWREVINALGEMGTVVAYDRPAFGLTERPRPGQWTGSNPYSPEAQVDLLFGLMDALHIQSAVLVGNSAGGTLAVNAALAHPERVQGLVLVDAAIYEGGGGPAWLRLFYQTPQMDRLGGLLVRSISTRGMEILYAAWHDPSKITPEIIAGYRKPLQAENWDVALWQMTKTSHLLGLAERLDELKLPVLVLTGDDDRIVPAANSLRLAKEIPGADLAVFADCGHVPQEECPGPFLEKVKAWIQNLND